ncbi:substrate-binding domain-containing protein [Streptomyces canus]|uniref:sugar ABC transporter substrate-binding protein n=1 Tax=Streptomyces canus TaxID=58343 RepID=UPI00039DFB7C|nr:substrate-binding domain-containing protein [Streptomyces canus]
MTSIPSRTRPRRMPPWLAGPLALACAVLLAACSTTTGPSEAAGEAALTPEQKKVLDGGFAGVFQKPPTDGPAAVRGKTVWFISCGENFEACHTMSASFTEAARKLGWRVKVVDSKYQAAAANTAIGQAIAARADGIVTAAFDCPQIKSGLLAARSAKVPVVNYAALDCDDPSFGSGESLFTATLNTMGSTETRDYYTERGRYNARFLAAELAQRGIKNPKVLVVKNVDQIIHAVGWKAFEKEMAGACPDCRLVPVTWNITGFPNPATQIVKSALTAHPDAAAVAYDSDSFMTGGFASAIRQSGRSNLVVCCGDGQVSGTQLIHEGVVTATSLIPYEYDIWATADTLNRIFSGADPAGLPNQGGGFIYVDAGHGLPAKGAGIDVPVDFKTTRERVWSGGTT